MKNFAPLSVLVFSLLLISACTNTKPADEASPFAMNLLSVDRQQFPMNSLSNQKGSVIIFLQPECPFCNSYGKTLRHLDSSFNAEGIMMVGVVAGKNYPDDEIKEYREKHQLKFPILLDPDFTLRDKLHATKTPEAFLLDANGKVLYRGMIDNWGYEIGKVRAQVTEHYLTDAAEAYLAQKPISLDSTAAIGCYIE